MGVFDVLKQIFPFAFVITWVGIGAVLFFRARGRQNAYLRRFEGEINFFAGDPIFFPGSVRAYRDTVRAMRERQPDADLERLRREMWRHFRYYIVWIFGFPIIVVGAVVLLILSGQIH